MLLEEFDPTRAVTEPEDITDTEVFEVCSTMIMPFSGDLFDEIVTSPYARLGGYRYNINGAYPWYIYEKDGQRVGVMKALLGAPAVIGLLEELKVVGFKQFILFGTCGVLDENLPSNRLIVPTAGVRDEGLSYHYAPASDEMAYSEEQLERFRALLDGLALPYIATKTWTTDAFFRETPDKVRRRKAMGCQVVDMEWTAVCAWARFRQASVYHFFYSSDFVNPEGQWDKRDGHSQQALTTFFEIAWLIAKEIEDD